MATEPLYQTDSYVTKFEAAVTDTNGGEVALDRSAFYPGGGGQPHDLGRLVANAERFGVTEMRRDGDMVWHVLDREGPAAGVLVEGVLDWDRRYSLMRTHTALHVLCGVVWRDYGAKVTGGNMQPLTARMDFEFASMKAELVADIEDKVNYEVEADRKISIRFMTRAEADAHPDLIRTKINLLPAGITSVRVVDIHGLDVQADGGTHVSRTHEVGPIEITGYKSKGKANKRIEIALGPAIFSGQVS